MAVGVCNAMVCYHPLTGWKAKTANPKTGKFPVVFNKSQGYVDREVKVPCGRCTGCRLERSRQWAIRCVHEAQINVENGKGNCFITLTYDDINLPKNRSLDLKHYQLFMKRLRHKVGKVRFYHCGEYGETTRRPHYHSILFGFVPDDLVFYKNTKSGERLYNSELLQSCWVNEEGDTRGFIVVGDVTFESCAYVSRYIMKKVLGEDAEEHYKNFVDPLTGEINSVSPEYTTMSRRPGIGAGWLEKYRNDVYPADEIVLPTKKGYKRMRPPKYYDRDYDLRSPAEFRKLKSARKVSANEYQDDNTPERLRIREAVQDARLRLLPRTVE